MLSSEDAAVQPLDLPEAPGGKGLDKEVSNTRREHSLSRQRQGGPGSSVTVMEEFLVIAC